MTKFLAFPGCGETDDDSSCNVTVSIRATRRGSTPAARMTKFLAFPGRGEDDEFFPFPGCGEVDEFFPCPGCGEGDEDYDLVRSATCRQQATGSGPVSDPS